MSVSRYREARCGQGQGFELWMQPLYGARMPLYTKMPRDHVDPHHHPTLARVLVLICWASLEWPGNHRLRLGLGLSDSPSSCCSCLLLLHHLTVRAQSKSKEPWLQDFHTSSGPLCFLLQWALSSDQDQRQQAFMQRTRPRS